MRLHTAKSWFLVALTLVARAAAADAPAPYSLPWHLRPALAVSVLRIDNTTATYRSLTQPGVGVSNVTFVLGAYRVWRGLSVSARIGWVGDHTPTANTNHTKAPQSGAAFVNPALGAWYSCKLPSDFRVTPFLGVTIPVGMGGGDHPDLGAKDARVQGVLARSAMDNAMFAVNDLTIFPGLGIAWVHGGATIQAEVTLLELVRVRGAADQPDRTKTNLTTGLHMGYFVLPQLSVGFEVRYQRWLAPPVAVKKDTTHKTDDNVSMSLGVRGHFHVGKAWLRPGIAYGQGMDDPMFAQQYRIVQLDLPVVFP